MAQDRETADRVDGDPEPPELGLAPLPEKLRRMMERTEFDAEQALAMFEYRIEVVGRLRTAALTQLRASDFVEMGASCYLQNKGAQRIGGLLGIRMPDEPRFTRIDEGGGNFSYVVSGWVGSVTLNTSIYVIGGRSSSDKWFDRFEGEGEDAVRIPPSDLDVRKAAYTNFENRAVSGLAGLRGLGKEDLLEMGFTDAVKIGSVSFQKGSKGGQSGSIVPGGADKGKPWNEASRDTILYWKKRAEEDLADKSKAKYHGSTKKMLESINHEIKARQDAQAAAPAAAEKKA